MLLNKLVLVDTVVIDSLSEPSFLHTVDRLGYHGPPQRYQNSEYFIARPLPLRNLPSTTRFRPCQDRLPPDTKPCFIPSSGVSSQLWPSGDGFKIGFFYFLHGLQVPTHLLQYSALGAWGDQFVWLYSPTRVVD